MSKQKEIRQTPYAVKLLTFGLISAGVFMLLLTAAALAQERVEILQSDKFPTGMICLAVSSVICGVLCSREKERGNILSALIGESVLFVILTVILLASDRETFGIRYILNIAVLLFGAFAGTLLTSRRGQRHRRKRKYR